MVAECGIAGLSIVEDLDEVEDGVLRCLRGLESVISSEFILKRPGEALLRGIVLKLTLAAHRTLHAQIHKSMLVPRVGVVACGRSGA